MEFDLETAKLVSLFTLVNLIAAAGGFLAVELLGINSGFLIFTALVFSLPIPTQYFFLKNRTDETE